MAEGVLTKIGKIKLVKAHTGDIVLPPITEMAFGDGGVDLNGNVIPTTGEETALKNMLLKKAIDGHSYPIETTARYTLTLSESELADKYISEQGLFDSEGQLIAYKTFMKKGKDGDMKFQFDMDEIL